MKKIALVTCYFQHNYGSQLQAYATQWLFDRMHIANETICIDGLRQQISHAKYRYFLSRIFDLNTVLDKLPTVHKALARLLHPAFKANEAIRSVNFTDFAKRMFRLSPAYTSKAEIAASYDAFVVGSDQLWLPSNIEADYYTLSWVPAEKPKIALATSFGVASLPRRQAHKAQRFLRRFNALSVREPSGVSLIQGLTGREATLLLDPTLLLSADDWQSQLRRERLINEPYICCYLLGKNPLPRAFVAKLKQATGLPIVQLPHCDDYVAADEQLFDKAIYDATCFDLLRLIRDARYVVTDSFHATAFSILFNKQFFTFRRYTSESSVSTNSRLTALLSELHLSNRMLQGDESVNELLHRTIDYTTINQLLVNMRQYAYAWVSHFFKLFLS